MTNQEYEKLKTISNNIRKHIINSASVNIPYHFGGSFSIIEILSYFYYKEIDLSKEKSRRNTFILSKGHACYALYSLFFEFGYISFKELCNYKKIGCRLQGHPDMTKLNCLDFSSGSLGQGLSVGVGIALANKINNIKTNVYVLLGDGEIQEGQIWEAAMTANKYKLDNLICLIDNNQLQVDGNVNDTNPLTSIADCFTSFGWLSKEVSDGHNFYNIDKTYTTIKNVKNKPKVIIFKTIKGKGVSFMENKKEWHCNTINENDIKNSLDELGD